jgi:TonB family protein
MRQIQLAVAAILGSAALFAQAAAPASADPAYYYPPKFNHQVKPAYPDAARVAHETGSVMVKVLVGSNGVPKSFTVSRSSGHKDLDAAVLAACKASTYSPATRGNTPIEAFYDVSYKFDLTGVAENTGSTSDLAAKVAAHPTDSASRLQLANIQLAQNDYPHAEATLAGGTLVQPSNAKIWSRLGLTYYNDGINNKDDSKFKLAAQAFDKALAIDPKIDNALAAQAYSRYAFNMQNSGQSATAQPYAMKAAQLDPKQFIYRMLVGETEVSLGQTKAALADLQLAQNGDDRKRADVSARLLAEIGNAQLTLGDESAGLASIPVPGARELLYEQEQFHCGVSAPQTADHDSTNRSRLAGRSRRCLLEHKGLGGCKGRIQRGSCDQSVKRRRKARLVETGGRSRSDRPDRCRTERCHKSLARQRLILQHRDRQYLIEREHGQN